MRFAPYERVGGEVAENSLALAMEGIGVGGGEES